MKDKKGKEAKMASMMPAWATGKVVHFIELEKLGGKTCFEWGSDSFHFRYAEFKTSKSEVQDESERIEPAIQ